VEGVTSTFLRRAVLLAAIGLFAAGPVVLFMGPANASNYKPLQTTRKNAGTPNSSVVVKNSSGVVIKYGNKYITYTSPASKLDKLGQALFMENCASCHGTQANGVPASGAVGAYPDLVGLGPATIDFWIDSGRMPDKDTAAIEAPRRQPASHPGAGRSGRRVGELALAELPRHSDAALEPRQRGRRRRALRP
jgi:cytochrome c5